MSRKDRLGLWLLAGVATFVAAFFSLVVMLRSSSVDQSTQCEAGDNARLHRVIIVDATDPLPPLALANLKQTVQEQREALAVQDRLWVFQMSANSIDLSAPMFSRCRPPRWEDVSRFNGNPGRAEQRYQDSFLRPLDQTLQELQRLLTATTESQSPILETIGRLAASSSFGPVDRRSQATRRPVRVIFVTDLLQNSPLFSTYGSAWKRRPQPGVLAASMLRDYGPVFTRLSLTILFVDRHEHNIPPQTELRDYWVAVLRAMDLTNLTIRML